jgi:3-oxoadipate enol-lactonase
MSVIAELHCELAGPPDAPPLVLASSLGTTHAMWEPQTAALARTHRVVSYDHPGHGDSPAPPGPYGIDDLGSGVLALLDRLEIERASWCGLSLGGMVGLWLAEYAPQRIERLVLICTSAHAPPPSAWAERAAAVRAAGSTDGIAEAVVARWFTEPYAASHPDAVARAAAMIRGCDPEGYAGCCAVIERLDLRGELGAVVAPTLVISAAFDTALPPEHGRVIAEGIAGARFQVLTDGAHLASIECDHEVTALIAEHLAANATTSQLHPSGHRQATNAGRRDG